MTSKFPNGFPVAGTPFLDDNGSPVLVWQQFLSSLYHRTGGGAGQTVVNSVVGETGDITLAELISAGLAPIASPSFLGTPTAPTPAATDSSTQIATTAFVAGLIVGLAPLNSPHLTGVPTAPTPNTGDSSAQIPNTAWVAGALSAYAQLVSPHFTGAPTAPTQAATDNSTKLATTAFVGTAMLAGSALPPVTATVGASPWAYKPGSAGTVYINGGAVTGVGITRTGYVAVLTAHTQGEFHVGPNDTLTVTYSATPLVQFLPS